jgi:hypothetical protein
MYDENIPIPVKTTMFDTILGMTKVGQSYWFDSNKKSISVMVRCVKKQTGHTYRLAEFEKDGVQGVRVWLVALSPHTFARQIVSLRGD